MKRKLIVIFVLALFVGVFMVLRNLPGKQTELVFRDNVVKAETPVKYPEEKNISVPKPDDYKKMEEGIISEFNGKIPKEWGVKITGVKTELDTEKKIVALTFDADAGGYDAKLIDYLKGEKVSATIFATGKWIDEHADVFQELSEDPLFEIENHGSNHKPCSVNGKYAYGIKGTANVRDIFYEIEQNARRIETLTGKKPKYYRPGTAYLDDVCAEIAEKLGYKIVNYNVVGDAGATFSTAQIKERLIGSKNGSIVIMHMNHPEKQTAQGVMAAIPEMKKLGFEFVKLSDYNLK
jgi:peptidoglycan/xylan/chitin deacetylase (PgdA/CDA1 family)